MLVAPTQTGQEGLNHVMTPHLVWHENEHAEVHSVDELDLLIDQLTIQAQQTMPFSIELSVNNETGLLVVVGCEESHMEFYSAQSKPPILGCVGPWDDDELIVFSQRGHYSEMYKRYCVPITEARKALRQYFQTGMRPDNIMWA